MIRQLVEEDRKVTLDFVYCNACRKSVYHRGYRSVWVYNPIQKLWGDFAEDGEMRGILLKYDGNFIVYAPGEFDAKGFAEIINR